MSTLNSPHKQKIPAGRFIRQQWFYTPEIVISAAQKAPSKTLTAFHEGCTLAYVRDTVRMNRDAVRIEIMNFHDIQAAAVLAQITVRHAQDRLETSSTNRLLRACSKPPSWGLLYLRPRNSQFQTMCTV